MNHIWTISTKLQKQNKIQENQIKNKKCNSWSLRSTIHKTKNKVGYDILVDNFRCLWMPHIPFPKLSDLSKPNYFLIKKKNQNPRASNQMITRFSISSGFFPRDNPSEMPLRTVIQAITFDVSYIKPWKLGATRYVWNRNNEENESGY